MFLCGWRLKSGEMSGMLKVCDRMGESAGADHPVSMAMQKEKKEAGVYVSGKRVYL